jgi:hypothetical protein
MASTALYLAETNQVQASGGFPYGKRRLFLLRRTM